MSDGSTGTLDYRAMFDNDRAEALSEYARDVWTLLNRGVHLLLIERPMGRLVATLVPEILTARAHEVAWTHGVQRVELTVPTIRKIVCGDARADKKAVQLAVEVAGWKCRTPHEADAVAVLLAGIEKAKTERLAA
jgi:hypothetical protein